MGHHGPPVHSGGLRLPDHGLYPPAAPLQKALHVLSAGEGDGQVAPHPGPVQGIVLQLLPGLFFKPSEGALPQLRDLPLLHPGEQQRRRLTAS